MGQQGFGGGYAEFECYGKVWVRGWRLSKLELQFVHYNRVQSVGSFNITINSLRSVDQDRRSIYYEVFSAKFRKWTGGR